MQGSGSDQAAAGTGQAVGGTPSAPGPGPAPEPVLAIARGNPSAVETAAVVVVLSALAAGPEQAARPEPRMGPRSEWSARYRLLRSPLRRGPGGWRASALPR
jgi:hypothetical protein